MREIRVTIEEMQQNLDHLLLRVLYNGERIVLFDRGEPKAAIIGNADLQQLRRLDADTESAGDAFERALAAADAVSERIRLWQEAHGIAAEDSVETLRGLRAERDEEIGGSG